MPSANDGHEFEPCGGDPTVCGRCSAPPEVHVVVVERRWVSRKRVVFEDVGVDRWFEIWYDPIVEGFVLEESLNVCEVCEFWNPKIDFDAETLGACWSRTSPKYREFTEHDDGCPEWAGSDRPPRRTAP